MMVRLVRSRAEYNASKYIRKDNTPEMAKYLGYLDARELYPDFEPIAFERFVDELVEGKGERPYEETLYAALKDMQGGQKVEGEQGRV